MDSDGSQIILIVLLVFFVIAKCFYTACECADIEVCDSRIKSLAEKDKKFERLAKLIEKPVKMIVSFSMGRTVFTSVISVLTVILCIRHIEGRLWAKIVLAALIVLGADVLITAITEILPKKLVGKNPEKFAAATVFPVRLLMILLSPLSALAYGISAVFCRLFSVPISSQKDTVTEEESK